MREDDERIESLLTAALATTPPRASAGFQAAVLGRTRPRRLSGWATLIMASYSLAAAVLCAWLLGAMPAPLVAGFLAGGAGAALAAGFYASTLLRASG